MYMHIFPGDLSNSCSETKRQLFPSLSLVLLKFNLYLVSGLLKIRYRWDFCKRTTTKYPFCSLNCFVETVSRYLNGVDYCHDSWLSRDHKIQDEDSATPDDLTMTTLTSVVTSILRHFYLLRVTIYSRHSLVLHPHRCSRFSRENLLESSLSTY